MPCCLFAEGICRWDHCRWEPSPAAFPLAQGCKEMFGPQICPQGMWSCGILLWSRAARGLSRQQQGTRKLLWGALLCEGKGKERPELQSSVPILKAKAILHVYQRQCTLREYLHCVYQSSLQQGVINVASIFNQKHVSHKKKKRKKKANLGVVRWRLHLSSSAQMPLGYTNPGALPSVIHETQWAPSSELHHSHKPTTPNRSPMAAGHGSSALCPTPVRSHPDPIFPWASSHLAEPSSELWVQDLVSSPGFPSPLQSHHCRPYKRCTQINSAPHFKLDFTLLCELCGISVLRPSQLHSDSTCEGITEAVGKQTMQLQPALCKCTGPLISSDPKALWLCTCLANRNQYHGAAKPGDS